LRGTKLEHRSSIFNDRIPESTEHKSKRQLGITLGAETHYPRGSPSQDIEAAPIWP
jgi:hypothetical protein